MLYDINPIINTFKLLDDWESRYGYLIELGNELEPLDEKFKTSKFKVSGCSSQVWLYPRWTEHNSKEVLDFVAASDAHIVKGLLLLTLAFYNGKTTQEALQLNINDFLSELNLQQNITQQRNNGIKAVVSKIQFFANTRLSNNK